MDSQELMAHCQGKPGAWPDHPWGHELPVFKVHDKIFAFVGESAVGLKAGLSREVADEWLQRYPSSARVMAYLGRSGWNDLDLAGDIPDDELVEAVDESYRFVVSRLPARHRPAGWDT